MTCKAIIFSAPSGAGKTSIVRHLIGEVPSLRFSISATTRAKRPNETEGKDYYFLSIEEFDKKVRDDEFLEWEEVYAGIKYGTLKEEVDRIWEEGNSVIFDVDVVGGKNLKRQFGNRALSVFVKVPSLETLRDRLSNRQTESEESLNFRVDKAMEEMTHEGGFDAVIVNDDLSRAQKEANDLVSKFLSS